MAGEAQKHFTFDLPHTVDEVLVLMAQAGIPGAANELIVRYREKTTRLILRLARGKHLSLEDGKDAVQEAVFFWTRRAIDHYDVWQVMQPHGCSFGTFLEIQVLPRYFLDFVRRLARRQKHDRQAKNAPLGQNTLPFEATATSAWQEMLVQFESALQVADPLLRKNLGWAQGGKTSQGKRRGNQPFSPDGSAAVARNPRANPAFLWFLAKSGGVED